MTSMTILNEVYVYVIEWEALYRLWIPCDAHNPPLKYMLHKVQTKKLSTPLFLRRHHICLHTHTSTQIYGQGGSIAVRIQIV
jgi:hypothetical protein